MVGQKPNLVGHLILPRIFPVGQNVRCVFRLVGRFLTDFFPTVILRPEMVTDLAWNFKNIRILKHVFHILLLLRAKVRSFSICDTFTCNTRLDYEPYQLHILRNTWNFGKIHMQVDHTCGENQLNANMIRGTFWIISKCK